MEVEKARWQRELSDAGDEVADARAIILKHSDRIRELERGFSLKPNPAESGLRVEIGNLRAELESYKQLRALKAEDIINALAGIGALTKDTKIRKKAMLEMQKLLGSSSPKSC